VLDVILVLTDSDTVFIESVLKVDGFLGAVGPVSSVYPTGSAFLVVFEILLGSAILYICFIIYFKNYRKYVGVS
jgi:hypothetical protein